MDIGEFIKNFATQFSVFVDNTHFRDLDEWSSLNAMAILNMISKKYAVVLKPEEMKETNSIQELFNLVNSKKGK